LIRGQARDEPTGDENLPLLKRQHRRHPDLSGAHKVVVTADHEFVVVGVNAFDRPGLLLDISKGLSRLEMNLRHTEASVVGQRSISIWRCEMVDSELPDLEEIWSVLDALMETESGSQAVKQRGLRVIRASVTKGSSLVGKPAAEINFRASYKAAIVAVQKGGKNVSLQGVVFGAGDQLVLQVSDDSPLLKSPPADFYKDLVDKDGGTASRSNSVVSFVNMLTKSRSSANMREDKDIETGKAMDIVNNDRNVQEDKSDDEDFFIGPGDFDDGAAGGQPGSEVMIANMVRANM